jgi:hypothetical protein
MAVHLRLHSFGRTGALLCALSLCLQYNYIHGAIQAEDVLAELGSALGSL